MISVFLVGAPGRMGREIVKTLAANSQTQLVGALGRSQSGRDAGEVAGLENLGVAIQTDLNLALQNSAADVVLDVSVPEAVKSNALTCIAQKKPLVFRHDRIYRIRFGRIGRSRERRRCSGFNRAQFRHRRDFDDALCDGSREVFRIGGNYRMSSR